MNNSNVIQVVRYLRTNLGRIDESINFKKNAIQRGYFALQETKSGFNRCIYLNRTDDSDYTTIPTECTDFQNEVNNIEREISTLEYDLQALINDKNEIKERLYYLLSQFSTAEQIQLFT